MSTRSSPAPSTTSGGVWWRPSSGSPATGTWPRSARRTPSRWRSTSGGATASRATRVPPAHLLPERTQSVLAVLYLLFNSGYSDPSRPDLSAEAIRLTRTLVALMPDEPEAIGLLALLLLHHGRRATRLDADGAIVAL